MVTLEQRLEKMTPLQRAVLALKETQERLDALERQQVEPIAIVGLACRFPGKVNSPEDFWRVLRDGMEVVTEIPPERWNAAAYYDPDPRAPGKMNTRWGGFVEGIEDFDNHFFGISDREATCIDPQHRLLLETAWEALEDAGLPPGSLRGSATGVFIGISHSEYGMIHYTDLSQADAFMGLGNAHCIAANRISFALALEGPSVAVDTACSASLVSTHLACRSLRSGECSLALAGGVNIVLSPMPGVNLTKAGLSSSDGHVRSFDEAATGYVRSEGAGLMVLKPLSAAIRDQDLIYAVIRGSAVNQNGASNGLMAPSRAAQERVLRQAYASAKVAPERVQYVETQGTGTRLGDAIEAAALGTVVGQARPAESPLVIGSVKTNLGHLESASGAASLLKVALALQRRQLPPSLHFRTPNPDIPFADLHVKVQQRLETWPSGSQPRVAGVSAFGFGGSNAHVVLEEAPARHTPAAPPDAGDRSFVLPLSARTEPALRALVLRYLEFLRTDPPAWRDICHTAAVGRDHHDCRLAVLASNPQEAAQRLADYVAGRPGPQVWAGRKPFGRDLQVGFLFAGGPELWRCSLPRLQQLVQRIPSEIDTLDALLRRLAGWPLASVLADYASWQNPAHAVPAVTALQLALAAWCRRAGLVPYVVFGHGLGELAAASTAGVVTTEEALQIALASGRRAEPQQWPDVIPQRPQLPWLSASQDGSRNGQKLDAAHWQNCLDAAECPPAALDRVVARRADVYLEFGSDLLASPLQTRLPASGEATVLSLVAGQEDMLLSALARLYAAGADLSWKQLAAQHERRVRLPTYPWQRQRLWSMPKNWLANAPGAAEAGSSSPTAVLAPADAPARPAETHTDHSPVRPRPELNTPYEAPRTALERTLALSWAEVLKLERVGVHDNFFELGGDSLLATILLNRLQEQLDTVIHVLVLFQSQTVHDLAAYLRQSYPDALRQRYPDELLGVQATPAAPAVTVVGDQEVELSRRLVELYAPARILAPVTGPRNRRAVFVLSPPRSGTTLLRVMLAGHPRLFAPPELELLAFDTLAARKQAYAESAGLWLEGAVRALMDACGCDADEARAKMAQFEAEGRTTAEFYRLLQEGIGERLLVDKTPSYAGQLKTLQRAEELFEEPLYVHLLRHPCGMIRSFVEYKLDLTYNARSQAKLPISFSPQQIGELTWTISHQNILQLLARIPAERQCRLRFEDLVRQPGSSMQELCRFLGLEYQEAMTQPYEHQEKKMLDGVIAEGRMQGDQKFVIKHKKIDPAVADEWRQHLSSDFLGPPTRRLAAEFGYEVAPPAVPNASVEPVRSGFAGGLAQPQAASSDADEILRHLDELSDEEVAALLQEHLADEVPHG